MKHLFFYLLMFCTIPGGANQQVSVAPDQAKPNLCREALFPLNGFTNSSEGLRICRINSGTSMAAYEIYVNEKKAFKVAPIEAKQFNVFMSNTYSVSCTERTQNGSEDVPAPFKIDTLENIDMSSPICVVATTINNRPIRAAYVFDASNKALRGAVFELTREQRVQYEALNPQAQESRCVKNFNDDGSPTWCLKQYLETKQECPSIGQSCFDQALVGAWMKRVENKKPGVANRHLPPSVSGWIIRPNGDVRSLAIDFDKGTLAEGSENLGFLKISYGCNGELYQDTYFIGSIGSYCGRYAFDEKDLGISKTKSQGLQYYSPVSLGKKFTEPLKFMFDAKLGDKPLVIPRIATTLPAYATVIDGRSGRRVSIRAFNDTYQISFSILELARAEQRSGESAGRVGIEQRINDHVSTEFVSKNDPARPNEITIDSFDLVQGRIAGRFAYAIGRNTESMRFEGRFDIPLYVAEKIGKRD